MLINKINNSIQYDDYINELLEYDNLYNEYYSVFKSMCYELSKYKILIIANNNTYHIICNPYYNNIKNLYYNDSPLFIYHKNIKNKLYIGAISAKTLIFNLSFYHSNYKNCKIIDSEKRSDIILKYIKKHNPKIEYTQNMYFKKLLMFKQFEFLNLLKYFKPIMWFNIIYNILIIKIKSYFKIKIKESKNA